MLATWSSPQNVRRCDEGRWSDDHQRDSIRCDDNERRGYLEGSGNDSRAILCNCRIPAQFLGRKSVGARTTNPLDPFNASKTCWLLPKRCETWEMCKIV